MEGAAEWNAHNGYIIQYMEHHVKQHSNHTQNLERFARRGQLMEAILTKMETLRRRLEGAAHAKTVHRVRVY